MLGLGVFPPGAPGEFSRQALVLVSCHTGQLFHSSESFPRLQSRTFHCQKTIVESVKHFPSFTMATGIRDPFPSLPLKHKHPFLINLQPSTKV
eukprot:1156026-Pelagomonas_calceolata.AAC.9